MNKKNQRIVIQRFKKLGKKKLIVSKFLSLNNQSTNISNHNNNINNQRINLQKSKEYIITKNLQKYSANAKKYNTNIINSIIFDKRSHIVAVFKNYLLWDETAEFLKRYYKSKESKSRLPNISEYYEKYTLFSCNYFGSEGSIVIIMNKFIKRKKQYMKYLEEKEGQEERRKKEANEILNKRKEKEEKNLLTKQKNEELIMLRRRQLIDKYTNSEEKIRKQKEDNNRGLMTKYLLAAMKREDTAENLTRYERQRELERLKKVMKIEKRNKRLDNIQLEKEKISEQKRTLGNSLAQRKKLLLDKVTNILTTGKYKTKEDIYKKVFNEEELNTLGYSKKNSTEKNSTKKRLSTKEGTNNIKNENGFFLTQGNNIRNVKDIDNVNENEKNGENEKIEVNEEENS